MGNLKRQQVTTIVLLLLLSIHQWTVYARKHHHKNQGDDDSSNCKMSTPEECDRECSCDEKPRICYYNWVLEHYMSLSGACANNETMSQCVYGDGTQKSLLTINRQLPGPRIVVCKGDTIVVDLANKAAATGTTIHWHGLFQLGTPYMDGVPLLTQCPILEENTFRYKFKAANSGSHMYHSHDGLQMMDGVSGSVTVRDSPCDEPNKIAIKSIDLYAILTDQFVDDPVDHFPGKRNDPDASQTATNVFINGLGINVGPRKEAAIKPVLAVFKVKPGLTYRMRWHNLCSTVCLVTIRISNHPLTIIAIDGESVKPFKVDNVVSGSGTRVDTLIKADQKVGTYWIYAWGLGECRGKVYQIAQLEYEGSTGPTIPQPQSYNDIPKDGVTFNPENITGCLNNEPDSKCIYQATCADGKLPKEIVSPKKHVVIQANVGFYFPNNSETFGSSSGNYYRYFAATEEGVPTSSIINNVSNIDAASPPLTQSQGYYSPTLNHCPSEACFGRQVYQVPVGATVDILICDLPGYADLNHPMHLHGHSFYVLAQGYQGGGTCTRENAKRILSEVRGSLKSGDNPCPAKGDTVTNPVSGWSLISFVANNPGVWLFHCHFTWHHVTGMSMVIQVGDRSQFPPTPEGFPTCGDYMPPIGCSAKENSW